MTELEKIIKLSNKIKKQERKVKDWYMMVPLPLIPWFRKMGIIKEIK